MGSVFFDAIFLSSFFAVTLICMTAAFWGTFLLVGRQPLLSETLAHASYPGLLLGALSACYCSNSVTWVCLFGCLASILGFWMVGFLEHKLRMHRDASLCFVLVSFFGCGVILASVAKEVCPLLYNRINAYLYGQAATLGFQEAKISCIMFFTSLMVLCFGYRQVVVSVFDKDFAATCGLKAYLVETVILIFVSLVIVSGVRSVGIVLISAMFVAPALAARQLSDRLVIILLLASIFGGICGALGSYISVVYHYRTIIEGEWVNVALPTGPLVVVVAGGLCLLSLLFSPRSGWFIRLIRRKCFLFTKGQEHLLKVFWYLREEGRETVQRGEILESRRYQEHFRSSSPSIRIMILRYKGLVIKTQGGWSLTQQGIVEAARLVRAHRLWESYLVQSLDFDKDQVHGFAEEMEHILTEELTQTISEFLNYPSCDPHSQIIPKKEE